MVSNKNELASGRLACAVLRVGVVVGLVLLLSA